VVYPSLRICSGVSHCLATVDPHCSFSSLSTYGLPSPTRDTSISGAQYYSLYAPPNGSKFTSIRVLEHLSLMRGVMIPVRRVCDCDYSLVLDSAITPRLPTGTPRDNPHSVVRKHAQYIDLSGISLYLRLSQLTDRKSDDRLPCPRGIQASKSLG
jgi:hypothetical protein